MRIASSVVGVLGTAILLNGCLDYGKGSKPDPCPLERILSESDAPCACGGQTVEPGWVAGECYCRAATGFGCPFPDECQPEVTAAGLDDVLAALPDYGTYGPYTSAVLPVSPDLVAGAALELDADLIPVPQDCADRGDCRPVVRFASWAGVDGVSLAGEDDPEHAWWGFKPLLQAEAGAAFRLRPVMYDTHPEGYNYMPLLMVVPACRAACGADQARCPEDQVCYALGQTYCNLCLAAGIERCACETPEGPAADGEGCWFMISGDMAVEGTCADGECEPLR